MFEEAETGLEADMPARLTKDPDWWRGAVIYQIYPRSFNDTKAGEEAHGRAGRRADSGAAQAAIASGAAAGRKSQGA